MDSRINWSGPVILPEVTHLDRHLQAPGPLGLSVELEALVKEGLGNVAT